MAMEKISASTPIGLESGASKALDGSHSVCRFESDLAQLRESETSTWFAMVNTNI